MGDGWTLGVGLLTTSLSFMAGVAVGRPLLRLTRTACSVAAVGATKLALVVREDLKMGKGKVAAQCSHGTVLAYQRVEAADPRTLQAWLAVGQPKVVLRAADLHHLQSLQEAAKAMGVSAVVVCDAGRTQVETGTPTVLALGPAPGSTLDRITGTLRLL